MKKIILFFLLSFLILKSEKTNAQTDTSFWFVAPEVSIHNGSLLDRPIAFHFSTYALPSTITISQPAVPTFIPITVSLAAYASAAVDLTAFIDSIENKPPDHVNNFGIYIHGTNNFSVYYEILGGLAACSTCNPEFFSLKGQNALGTSFWIPMQKAYDNNAAYVPVPSNAFEIVATQNGTVVTITPTQNLVGHLSGIAYNVSLNKGQTYSATGASTTSFLHPSGSTVTSNLPIAITMKDDLIHISGTDILGDQIIPENRIGTEYIVVKAPQSTNDIAVILATQNGTQISVNGALITTIVAGQTYQCLLNTFGTGAIYISTSNPVYVLQLTTSVGEAGGAILPPITCTGSTDVCVTRSTSQPFHVFLITKTGNQGNFFFNGAAGIILPTAFTTVPGTAGLWKYADIDLSANAIVGSATRITNTSGLFHMGLLQGLTGGSGYGYFSGFSLVNTNFNASICPGGTTVLHSSIPGAAHVWNDNSTADSLIVSSTGTYWVVNNISSCSEVDTFHVTLTTPPSFSLGNDTSICVGNSITLSASLPGSYLWSTSSTATSINVSSTGNFSLAITNSGCVSRDTIQINIVSPPSLIMSSNTSVCAGGSTSLFASSSSSNLNWSPSSTLSCSTCTNPIATPIATTTYHCTAGNGCNTTDSVIITVNPLPPLSVSNDTSFCIGGSIQLHATSAGSAIMWTPGGAGNNITVNTSGTYHVTATQNGCQKTDSVIVNMITPPTVDLGNDTTLCNGQTILLNATTASATFYNWVGGTHNPTLNVNTSGNYFVDVYINACKGSDTINIFYKPNPIVNLGSDTTLCIGSAITLNATNAGATYNWNTASTNPSIIVSSSGNYTVTVTLNGCSITDDINVFFADPSNGILGNDTSTCMDYPISLFVKSGTNPLWNNGSTANNISVSQSGDYWVTVNASCGIFTDTIHVNVEACPCQLFVPDAFSPNGDVQNNIFRPIHQCPVNVYDLKIYNRWGQKVFESNDIAQGWKGTFKEIPQEVGVYVWVINYIDEFDGKNILLKGNLTLVR